MTKWCLALLFLSGVAAAQPLASRIRVYYIAADEVVWNYTPTGRNLAGIPHVETSEDSTDPRASAILYKKAIYREYTDSSFSHLKPRPPAWEHLGILGPLIRAEVGDTVRIVFKNQTHLKCTMHAHGLAYEKASEGASYNYGPNQSAKEADFVAPGCIYTYIWTVPERAGPGQGDGSSVIWMYHSHFIEDRDMNTGLLGPIIVTGRGLSKPDGTPQDVDREFVAAFAVFDESQSWFFEANRAKQTKAPVAVRAGLNPYLIYSINGFIEGNMPMLNMRKGERVRWYFIANGNADDVHTPHWHNETVLANHMRTDTIQLTPMGMSVADMVPDSVGTWLFHCHVADHFEGGMQALFTVLP